MAGRRRHSANLETAVASLRPTPPSTARTISDITNGGVHGLNDAFQKQLTKAVAEKTAEVTRLSAKTIELMSKLKDRDEEGQRMEVALEAAKRERAKLQWQLQGQKEGGSRGPSRGPSRPASPPAAVPKNSASAGLLPVSPQVREKVLRTALQDADIETKRANQELAKAKLSRDRTPPLPPPVANTGAQVAAGTVAKLQAELLEAAEERRASRAQSHSVRERCRELEAQLAERASQLAAAERARQLLVEQMAAAAASGAEARSAGADARSARTAQNAAEARGLDLERRLAIAQAKLELQEKQLAQLKLDLSEAGARGGREEQLERQLAAAQAELQAPRPHHARTTPAPRPHHARTTCHACHAPHTPYAPSTHPLLLPITPYPPYAP